MPYRDKAVQREYQRLWVQRRRAAYFMGKSCVQCDSTHQLELDHIDPSTKEDHRIWSWSAKRRLAELAKCQVLCSSCHADKTQAENSQPWRQRYSTHRRKDEGRFG